MSRMSAEDKAKLFRLDHTDDISRLTMLRPATIRTLNEQKIFVIEDLVQLEPVALMTVCGIDEDEREKLLDITMLFFNGAYDNLHG